MEPKRAMEAIIGRFCDIFDLLLGNHMPWSDRTVIADCEKQVKEAASGASDEVKSEKIMQLLWALVHSKQQKNVQRGIDMLEALLTNCSSPLENGEKLYLLGVGYYRTGKFPRSGQLADQCLEITPDWSMALTLKKDVEDRLARDVAVEIGVTASAVGLIGHWLAIALTRVVREKLRRLQMVPQMKQRMKALCGYHGLLFIPDDQKMYSVELLCLKIAPDWRQALTLKKAVDDRITKDGVIGIGITATAVGVIVGGIAAALARKN